MDYWFEKVRQKLKLSEYDIDDVLVTMQDYSSQLSLECPRRGTVGY